MIRFACAYVTVSTGLTSILVLTRGELLVAGVLLLLAAVATIARLELERLHARGVLR
jgi:hypothetical protein